MFLGIVLAPISALLSDASRTNAKSAQKKIYS